MSKISIIRQLLHKMLNSIIYNNSYNTSSNMIMVNIQTFENYKIHDYPYILKLLRILAQTNQYNIDIHSVEKISLPKEILSLVSVYFYLSGIKYNVSIH